MRNPDYRPTLHQLMAAHALAAAHHHEWAFYPLTTFVAPDGVVATLDEIAERVDKDHYEGLPQGQVPVVDEAGCLYHTTCSGRLQWFIRPSGATTLRIMRPGNVCVLSAVVYPGRHATGEVLTHGQEYHVRHARALRDAMLALQGVEASIPASVWQDALPDPIVIETPDPIVVEALRAIPA